MLSKVPQVLVALSLIGGLALVGCSDDDDGSPDTGPSAPTGLSVVQSRDTIYVSWTASSGATFHVATLTTGSTEVASDSGGATFEETLFAGLDTDTDYTVEVVAGNENGVSVAAEAPLTSMYCDVSDQSDPQLTLRLESSILWDNVAASSSDADANFADASGDGYDPAENKEFFNWGFNNMVANPNLPSAAFDVGTQASPPNLIPTAMPSGYTAFDASTLNGATGLVMPTDGRTLQSTNYAGAVAPGTSVANAWYSGWTVWATDGSDSRPVCASPDVVSDSILSDTTWTADNCIRIEGPIFVGRDVGADGSGGTPVTLTIEPGATILGELQSNLPGGTRGSYIVISRGSKIIADAMRTAADAQGRPFPDSVIVFTSNAPAGSRARGDWGGIVLNGRAPINSGAEATGEGDSGLYGGTAPNDDSGILRGVRVEFAGDAVTATDELNGIALQGTGAGTTIDYVQIHYNKDDGTEPFGGTTSQTHVVVTGIADDSFDGTDGYRGFMQFLIAQQRADDADNGFEISNNGDAPGNTPKSMAVVANATMVGSGFGGGAIQGLGTEGDVGILFREGSHYRLFNVITVGFGDSGFDVEGAQTAANADCRIGK